MSLEGARRVMNSFSVCRKGLCTQCVTKDKYLKQLDFFFNHIVILTCKDKIFHPFDLLNLTEKLVISDDGKKNVIILLPKIYVVITLIDTLNFCYLNLGNKINIIFLNCRFA